MANKFIEEQKAEAIKRMKALKMYPECIREFSESKLNRSEFGGILYWLNEEERQMVENFEKEYGAKVYHVIKNIYRDTGNPLYSLLYVSENKEEWELDREDLKDGYPFAYVVGDFSEFGSIGIKPQWGGLARIS